MPGTSVLINEKLPSEEEIRLDDAVGLSYLDRSPVLRLHLSKNIMRDRFGAALFTAFLPLLLVSTAAGQVARMRVDRRQRAVRVEPTPSSPYLIGQQPPRHTLQHQGTVRGLAFSADGKFLASAAGDQTARLWGATSGVELRKLEAQGGAYFCLAFCPQGRVVALGTSSGFIRIWDVAANRPPVRLAGTQRAVHDVAFSPDGKLLASAGEDGTICVWEWSAGKVQKQFGNHRGAVDCVVFSPDGRSVASSGEDGSIRIWNARDGKEQRHLEGHQGPVPVVRFSPDGATLVSAGQDQTIRFWEVSTGEELRRLTRHEGRVRALAFSDDGRTLASAGADHVIRLWEVAGGEERMELRGHAGEIDTLAFAPGGRLLASGSDDRTARLWDASGLPARSQPLKLSAQEVEKRWSDLASPDAARAYRALWILADAGGQVLPFIREHLPHTEHVATTNPERVSELVAELDNDQFATREKATEELEQIGKPAEAPLRKLLSGRHSAEAALRATYLLENLKAPLLTTQRLRSLRTIELLERIGTREARRLVQELAEGPADARLMREAKASLDRLSRQQVTR
jgi:hypothetical protein